MRHAAEYAAFIGAAIAFSAVPAAFFWLAEPRVAGVKHSILSDGLQEFRTIAGARSVWIAALFLLCVCLPQTFPTVLYFHQTTTLKFPVADIGHADRRMKCPLFEEERTPLVYPFLKL